MAAKRVVVVDDTMSIGRFLQAALLTLDKTLSISVVPSAEEALLETGHYAVDLIIADINLPGISGVEMARKVHARFPEVKVILISGMSDVPIAEYAREVNAVAYFLKPLDTAQFLQTARDCLGLSEVETPPEAGSMPRLSDALASLHRRLDAVSVVLLDERGRVAAQAGEPPEIGFEDRWAPALLAAASSGEKAARLLGEAIPGSVLAFCGAHANMLVSAAGVLTLVVTLKPGSWPTQAIETMLEVQGQLTGLLKEMGLKVEPAVSSVPLAETAVSKPLPMEEKMAEESVTPEFAALFENPQQGLPLEDAENFWENVAVSSETAAGSADVLSFEQAKKIGLVED